MPQLTPPKWQAAPDSYPILLQNNEVHIWYFTFSTVNQTDGYWHLLTPEEQDHALRFYFQKDRQAYLLSRGILRSILAKYICVTPKAINLNYTSHGKPLLDPKQNSLRLHFNVSHTHQCILYAITKNIEIGIDVEYLKHDVDYQGMAKNFFSAYEYQTLIKAKAEQQSALFYQIWTCKEAFIKAIGLGLSYSLADFDVIWQEDQPAKILNIKGAPLEAAQWNLHAFIPVEHYRAVVAIQQPIHKISYYQYTD